MSGTSTMTLSPAEETYARLYADFLSVGDPPPRSDWYIADGCEPARLAEIRRLLEQEWRTRARRMLR